MSQVDEPFEVLLGNLLDSDHPLRAAVVYRLSEPTSEELALLKESWPAIPAERKRTLLARIVETSETHFELDFADFARFALHDQDPIVRVHAIEALWTSEDPGVMGELVGLLKHDPEPEVRAAAAEGLGQFVLLGELGHLSAGDSASAEQALIEHGLQPTALREVYQRALESLAYSGRDEITGLIASAAAQDNIDTRASALLAMGRHGDQRWSQQILDALGDREGRIRFEAARASGELGLTDAVPLLIRLAGNASDREIQAMAIWALGEIGGDDAQQALLSLADSTADEDLLDAIEDATNMAALSLGEFGMYVLSPDDDDEFASGEVDGLDLEDDNGQDSP